MGIHSYQAEIDAGYRQGKLDKWTCGESHKVNYLDLEAALNDPEAMAFAAELEAAIELKRDIDKINYFMKGLDEWLKQH